MLPTLLPPQTLLDPSPQPNSIAHLVSITLVYAASMWAYFQIRLVSYLPLLPQHALSTDSNKHFLPSVPALRSITLHRLYILTH